MANTRDVVGEQACLDAIVAGTITSLEDDGVTHLREHALNGCGAMTSLKLDNCESIGYMGAASCQNLVTVDIKGEGFIYDAAFDKDSLLTHLILRGNEKTSVSSIASIGKQSPLDTGDGAVYVPQDLVSTYKGDNNWRNYVILPISEYPKQAPMETVSDTWTQIIASSQDGTYSSKYEVGDVKSVIIDSETCLMQLVAKDADTLASDSTKTAPMTWMLFKRTYSQKHRMNPASTGESGTGSNGGWENCEMRSWLSNTLLPLFPSELQGGIKEVRKYSDYIVPGETSITHDQLTYDKLWIPSARECNSSSYEQSGVHYQSRMNSAMARTKYSYSGTGTDGWWLRTAATVNNFRYMSNSGSVSTASAQTSYAVVFGFCI